MKVVDSLPMGTALLLAVLAGMPACSSSSGGVDTSGAGGSAGTVDAAASPDSGTSPEAEPCVA